MNFARFKHDIKALEPVIAAIILIAVTVAIAIAVAVWMGALTLTYTKTEELRVIVTSFGTTDDPKYILVKILNTGSATTTVIDMKVNDAAPSYLFITKYPVDSSDLDTLSYNVTTAELSLRIAPGETWYVAVQLSSNWTPNTIYRVSVTTSNNNVFWGEARAPTG